MSQKTIIAIACAAVVVIGGCVAYAVSTNSKKDETTTVESTVSQTQSVESTTEKTTETTTETTTEATTEKKDYSFLKDNVWYIYDDEKVVAYGFRFEDDDSVTVAYFIEDNLNGEDAKYSKNKVSYKVEGDKVVITGLPESYNTSGFTLKISGDSLLDESGKALDKQKDLQLEYPFDHFNAQ